MNTESVSVRWCWSNDSLIILLWIQSPCQLDDVEAMIREDTGYEADMSTAEFVDVNAPKRSSKQVTKSGNTSHL